MNMLAKVREIERERELERQGRAKREKEFNENCKSTQDIKPENNKH